MMFSFKMSAKIPNIFYHPHYTPRVMRLALPVVISMLSITALINVDVMMVGRLGKEAVAATGLGGWVYLTIMLTLSSIEVGTQALVARRVGERRFDECGKLTTISLAIALTVGSLLLLVMIPASAILLHSEEPSVYRLGLNYLKIRLLSLPFSMSACAFRGFFYGIGNSIIPMITEIIINMINISLNYVLIFGKLGFEPMGVMGAALGSYLANFTAFIILFIAIMQKKYRAAYNFPVRLKHLRKEHAQQIIWISYPVFLQSFFIHLGFYVFLLINDRIGVQAVAASNIALAIITISFLPAFGFGIAATTLIGQMLGKRKPDEAERFGWFCLGPGIIIMGIMGLIFVLFGEQIMSFYIHDSSVIRLGTRALFLVGCVEVFDAFGAILSRGLQGAGLTRYVMLAEIFVNWLIFLPLAYLLGVVLQLGISGTWIAMVVYIVLFATIMFRKFIRGDWKTYFHHHDTLQEQNVFE